MQPVRFRDFVRWSKPQRYRRWLHRLVSHREQLPGEGIEVDLVAQPGAERLDGLGRVVLTPVEAAVNSSLDATPSRLEQGGHGQGDAGHRPARRLPADPAN